MMYPLWPASWPVWLRKLLPYSRRFANAASFHDWAYDHMGDEWGRRWADLEFFELMLDDCDTLPQAVCAFLYFALVRIFWWAFFAYFETFGAKVWNPEEKR